MKFSFINPGPNVELSIGEKGKMIGASPPLGMLYIATVLKEDGVEVSLLDQAAEGLSVRSTVEWMKKEDPDILGFSTLSSSGRTAARLAQEVRKENPDVLIVFGNYHATFNAERVLKKYPFVDLIIRGEGEHTSLELVRCLNRGNNLKDVRGITFRKKNLIISTPDRPPIKDIDALPFPERKLLDVEYHNTTVGINVAPKKFSGFLSSRGCVYQCRFCGCTRFAHNLWRARSVDNILEELHLLESEGYKQIMFVDDNFTLNRKRAIELCRRIRKEKIDMEWICEGRVDQCSYEMLRESVKAGCVMLYLGIESSNQRILNYYNKTITPQQSEDAVRTAKKAGVDVVVGSFIVGAPGETRQEIRNTLEFAQRLDIDIPQFNILGAFPGTDIWDELKTRGVLDEERYWETGLCISDFSPDTVPFEEIKEMIRQYYEYFFLRPRFLFKQVLRTVRSRYRMNLTINNLNRIDVISESVRHLSHL